MYDNGSTCGRLFARGATGQRRAAAGAAFCLGLLVASAAEAATCVVVDESKDGLDPADRAAAKTLFEEALSESKVSVAQDGCTETWTIYHVKLGESVTVVVQGPQGTRRERVKTIEDLPGTYSQMARSLIAGVDNTVDSEAVDRRNVTDTQMQRKRIKADAVWYAKLGYGSTPAAGFHAGPAFGFGRRWELDRFGINLGFLSFITYQDSDEFEGVSASWIDLGADYFFDPYGNSSPYVGAGLSLGNHSIPDAGGTYEGVGLQGKATVGYEVFRASTIRLFGHVDATLPMYRLSRTVTLAGGEEETQRVYSPTFALSLGLGWGGQTF